MCIEKAADNQVRNASPNLDNDPSLSKPTDKDNEHYLKGHGARITTSLFVMQVSVRYPNHLLFSYWHFKASTNKICTQQCESLLSHILVILTFRCTDNFWGNFFPIMAALFEFFSSVFQGTFIVYHSTSLFLSCCRGAR